MTHTEPGECTHMWEALNLAYGYVFTVCLYVSQAEDLEGLVARDGIFHDPC